ncbi:MAG: serine protease, partial [Frankiales bacterium]|nr:serine protease [Frankiales bacterium]
MRRTAPLLALTALGMSLLVPVPAAVAATETTRIVVLLASGAGSARGALQLHQARGQVLTSLPALSGYVAQVPVDEVAALAQDPSVEAVEVDGLVRGLGTVQVDPPAGLDRLDQRSGRNGTFAPSGTGAGVTAYVLDSGINTTHRDLAGRATSVRDYVNPGGDGEDCNGHGTHVAGILGGTTYGVAKQVKLRSVRVLDCRNEGYISTFLRGLDHVIAAHAAGTPAVVNLSLASLQPSAVIDAAVRRVVADGVTVVAAAGNDDRDACASSPARVPEVVTVGATGENDRRASFSNSGRCVDLFAPGLQVRSASWLDDTGSEPRDGTSQAAPHVAGAAALVLQASPRATPAQVAATLAADSLKGAVTSAAATRPDLLHVGGGAPAPAPPPQDAFAAAGDLTGDRGTTTSYLVAASAEPGEPAHAPGHPAVHSLWWSFTAPRDGTLALNVVGDDVDTVLAVYTGTAVDALTAVASNDDGSRASHASALALPVRKGQTYRVAVDGYAGETGPVTLAHRLTTGPADLAAPRITSLAVNPSTAPVGTGPAVVTVTLRMTDELGARDPVVDLRDSNGRSAGAARARRMSGTAQDGLYRATVLVAKGTRAGTYRVRTFPTRDVVGNTAAEPGPPSGLTGAVTVTAGPT